MFKVLLVTQNRDTPPGMFTFLWERDCEIRDAHSYQEAWAVLEAERLDFDLVLSPIRIGNCSGLDLANLLEGSKVSLFYSYAVEQGSWWMPALCDGTKCFGTAALRSSEFSAMLDEMIQSALVKEQLRRARLPKTNRKIAS